MRNQTRKQAANTRVNVRPYRVDDFEFVRHIFSSYTREEKSRLVQRESSIRGILISAT